MDRRRLDPRGRVKCHGPRNGRCLKSCSGCVDTFGAAANESFALGCPDRLTQVSWTFFARTALCGKYRLGQASSLSCATFQHRVQASA